MDNVTLRWAERENDAKKSDESMRFERCKMVATDAFPNRVTKRVGRKKKA